MMRSVQRSLRVAAALAATALAWPADAADLAAPAPDDETTRITLPSGVSLFVNPRDGGWAPGAPGDAAASIDILAPAAPSPVAGFGAALKPVVRLDDRPLGNGMVAGGFTDRVFGAYAGEEARGLGLQVNFSTLGAYVTAGGQYAQGALAHRPASRSGLDSLLVNGMGPPLFTPQSGDGGLESAQTQAHLSVGYDVNMGAFRFGSFGSLAYSRTQTGDYLDRRFDGAVAYGMNEATAQSVRAGLGVTASYVFNTENAVVLPQVRFGWEQAFRDDTRKPGLDFLGDGWIAGDADRGAFNLGFSVGTFMTGGIAGFVDFDVLMNNASSIDGSAFTFGVRKQF